LKFSKNLPNYEEWENTLNEIERGQNLFYKDLEYKNFFYVEALKDKEMRLKEIWLTNKKNRLTVKVGEENKHQSNLFEVRKQISELIRDIRRLIDQYLMKNRKPIFFGRNIRFYDREDVLFDSEINFHQIKRFLSLKPSILKNDPSITYHYLDLIEAITRKKIIENSMANFEKPNYIKEQIEVENDDINEDKISITEKIFNFGEKDFLDYNSINSEVDDSIGNVSKKKLLENKKKVENKILDHFKERVKGAINLTDTKDETTDKNKKKPNVKVSNKKDKLDDKSGKKSKSNTKK